MQPLNDEVLRQHITRQHLLVALPFMAMMTLELAWISRELKGRTRTATFTDDMLQDTTLYNHLRDLYN